MQATWQETLKNQLENKYVQESLEWVDINVSTAGLLNLTIVSDRFLGLSVPQRKEQILNLLNQFPASLSTGFLSLYTRQEAESLNLTHPQSINENSIYTWQDLALQAANPQNQPQIQREPRVPRTVTFYSFKGGVGRTTALTHVAWILAMRGRKVVAVDLDLEAPGLSTAFNLNPQPKYGIVDYFYDRSYLPKGVDPNISVTQIFGEVRIPNATGRLFVVPAGFLELDYISKVDDLRATTVTDSGENLWSVFSREIQEQLKPDVLLVDSRTGINQWGALSLLQAADEVIIFLFPNEQNRQGIELLLQSLNSLKYLSISFVFTPVPDIGEVGMTKIRKIWTSLSEKIKSKINEIEKVDEDETEESELGMNELKSEAGDPLVIPYLPPIALADNYPVPTLVDYYTRIANLIDEETDELQRKTILTGSDRRWNIVESLYFPAVNAADPQQDLSLLFQRTTDFERFLDDTTCLIRGRKGTGKTALYWLLLKHNKVAQQLAHGRLDNTICFSGHGRFHESRPSRDEFQVIHKGLQEKEGFWEAFWRVYLLFIALKENYFSFPKGKRGEKFSHLKETLNNLSKDQWQYEHTQTLLQLASNSNLLLIVKDAIDIIDEQARSQSQILWFLYDDLDEDFPEKGEVRQQALTGLFQFIQACDARRITAIRFKVFLREDIWNRLNFDNKSHFNGRDLLLQWNRIDFLRLALRQAVQSKEFKNLVDRFSPIESIDQANEGAIDRALELLWGSRRRRGSKAKYVSRWVYERLTDSSDTTFPRSLSILLEGAKEQELSYKGQSSKQSPTDRLLRGTSLEVGLKKASEERCNAVKEEYPDLGRFFNSLKDVQALLSKEELQTVWQGSAQNVMATFDEFSDFLSEIGLAEWREKEQRYKFADIYVYGFEMVRRGTV
jgi:cellulose biosynthesis protein BcsQ